MTGQVKRKRRPVSGIIILDKPYQFSSNAALQKVRWLLTAEKGGHTGSLDPLATGVLPLCFGEATKFSQYLLNADKCYEAIVQLGVTTETGDAEGEVLETKTVSCSKQDVLDVLPQFTGAIQQVPPMYSAIKQGGQPLYKLARAGEVVDRESREISIEQLELVSFDAVNAQVKLFVACSKGTYIRTLAEDIGNQLECGAHIVGLCRTQVGRFSLAQSISLDKLIEVHDSLGSEALDQFLLPVDAGLIDWPVIQLTEHTSYYWLHGQAVRAPDIPLEGLVRVQDHTGRFIGIGAMDDQGRLAPKRLVQTQ